MRAFEGAEWLVPIGADFGVRPGVGEKRPWVRLEHPTGGILFMRECEWSTADPPVFRVARLTRERDGRARAVELYLTLAEAAGLLCGSRAGGATPDVDRLTYARATRSTIARLELPIVLALTAGLLALGGALAAAAGHVANGGAPIWW